MALTRQIPISWDTPSSWSRQGWEMNSFNPERQLNMLDREMRDMNLRSGMRDMNMRSDNQISNMKSEFDRWAANVQHDDRLNMQQDDRLNMQRDDRLNMRTDNQIANMRSEFDRWANMQCADRIPYRPLSTSVMPMTTVTPMTTSMSFQPTFDSSMNYSMREMDREMKRMSEEMNRMFSHCQHLIPVDSQPETWRTRENFLLENPIIHSRDGRKKFQLQFDVRQFKPEEITVRTAGKQLSVHARHEEKDDNKSVFREYNRQYMIPVDIDQESLISKLTKEGLLTIEAPLPAVEESTKLIPIEHK